MDQNHLCCQLHHRAVSRHQPGPAHNRPDRQRSASSNRKDRSAQQFTHARPHRPHARQPSSDHPSGFPRQPNDSTRPASNTPTAHPHRTTLCGPTPGSEPAQTAGNRRFASARGSRHHSRRGHRPRRRPEVTPRAGPPPPRPAATPESASHRIVQGTPADASPHPAPLDHASVADGSNKKYRPLPGPIKPPRPPTRRPAQSNRLPHHHQTHHHQQPRVPAPATASPAATPQPLAAPPSRASGSRPAAPRPAAPRRTPPPPPFPPEAPPPTPPAPAPQATHRPEPGPTPRPVQTPTRTTAPPPLRRRPHPSACHTDHASLPAPPPAAGNHPNGRFRPKTPLSQTRAGPASLA